ncbi:hypothetical protein KEM56_002073 [Ascosphaera pollenicola]|nr:hypothetical protein KEM56_002073 [Ascosphaera pollenicola]
MSHELPQEQDPPRKRLKTSDDSDDRANIAETLTSLPIGASQADTSVAPKLDEQGLREAQVGITNFVSPELPGFEGILKKRYTDFLVNEIEPSGQVLHLRSTELPEAFRRAIADAAAKEETSPATEASKPVEPEQANAEAQDASAQEEANQAPAEATPEFKLSDDDRALMESYFGAEIAASIVDLHDRALKSPHTKVTALGRVKSNVITDRDLRTNIHQAIRRIFAGKLESSTDTDGCMVISVNPPKKAKKQKNVGRGGANPRRDIRGKLGWSELGGEYLHFTLYKENKDTMEVISFLARHLKMNPKSFQFAGTKDRRGVTAQRACVYRVHADRLAAANKSLRSAVVGDFEYKTHGLDLGDLSGNEFVITLRDCSLPRDPSSTESDVSVDYATQLVSKSLRQLRERGYFNYYGLQRFGTFATRTDEIGVKMLQEDFQGAVNAILEYNADLIGEVDPASKVGTDDIARARAIHTFRKSGKANAALDTLPRKFSAESNIIRHLGRARNDYKGALQAIPRNLRLMYVHAYQSLVWNFAVGERWKLYGNKLVEGDLVLIRDIKAATATEKESTSGATATVDADGEVVILPDAQDSAQSADDVFERARPLTAEEAASGKFSIFDLVLPLPGFDVVYPENAMKDFYKSFMGSDRGGHLDPFDMRRSWKDISLSGGYRKVLSRPGEDYGFRVKKYINDDEQFVKTDLERMRGTQEEANVEAAEEAREAKIEKLAIILTIQLGTSQYATMALRELMKTGGVKTYKPDFGSGR